MKNNSKLRFSEDFVFLKGKPIRFDGRLYLPEIFHSDKKNIVIRASRQVEKSTFLSISMAYELCKTPGVTILLVTPRQEQAWVFARTRLVPLIQQSPILRRVLFGKSGRRSQIENMTFDNGSQCHIRAAYNSADAVRGISADHLFIDEVQDVKAGDLPVLQETLSHSRIGKTILTGTPKLIENHLEAAFARSTANEWTLACSGCGTTNILDQSCLGPRGVTCRQCQSPLDVANGQWVARNPASTWGDGFWLNHLMVPWLNYDEILERKAVYEGAKFNNEALGLSTELGDHVVTRAELEACCSAQPMATSSSDMPGLTARNAVAGIDWGGGGTSRTVITIGHMRSDYVFEVGALYRFRADEDTNQLLDAMVDVIKRFNVRLLAADGGGNGHVLNRLLLDRLNYDHGMYAILYSSHGQEPRQEGLLHKWVVNRSATIGVLFSRVKKRSITFPRVADCGSFLDEFSCVLATYDDATRTVRYTHPDTMQDDAMHATNYALILATRQFQMRGAAE